MFKGSKNAFTLAEVLITLGIIGVVAAMTMPTLMNSTQGAQYRTGFKKALSVLSQAVVLNVALDDYDLSQATSGSVSTGTQAANLYQLFKKRMNVSKAGAGAADAEWGIAFNTPATGSNSGNAASFTSGSNYVFHFNDGIVLTFPNNAAACGTEWAANNCKGAIDLNGNKRPNRQVTCQQGSTDANCKVTNPTDVYPIRMYGQTIVPNSVAARQVMYGGK